MRWGQWDWFLVSLQWYTCVHVIITMAFLTDSERLQRDYCLFEQRECVQSGGPFARMVCDIQW